MPAATPLRDITVVELGHSVAAPYAGEILGDLGATVIKIEKRDGGDDARKWAPPYWHGLAAIFQSLNRNKLSAVVDLRDAGERELLTRLVVERADVLIQNLRPGMVEELGLDAATLRGRNKRLIYCNIGAFGRGGPLSDRPGYDPLMQAFGGLMSVPGEAGQPPVRVGTSIIDVGAGNDKLFRVLARTLGHPEWVDDPRFADNPERVRNRDALDGMIEDVTRTRTSAEWQVLLEAAGVPSAPMQNVDEVLAHPQTQALGIVQPSPDGRLSLVGLPLSFDGERPPFRLPAPQLGEHTRVLDEPAPLTKAVSRR